MSTNIKFALATIPVGAFVVYHAFFILSFDKRIGELEKSVREMRREIQRSESAVSLNNWPEGESVIWTNNTIWYPPTFGRAVDGILAWASEASTVSYPKNDLSSLAESSLPLQEYSQAVHPPKEQVLIGVQPASLPPGGKVSFISEDDIKHLRWMVSKIPDATDEDRRVVDVVAKYFELRLKP